MKWFAAVLLAGCATQPANPNDIVGPFTGPTERFVVDRITLPANNKAALDVADDLDGDGTRDNQLGAVIGSLTTFGDAAVHPGDMIRSGVIASSVEIQADDLIDDPAAGVTYVGADGEAATVMGGRFSGGAFTSNRSSATDVPGQATMHLPVLVGADPVVFELDHMEIDLSPDGSGGFDAVIRGTVDDRARPAVARGLAQMAASDPPNFPNIVAMDSNRDGVLAIDEIVNNTLFLSLMAPDITIGDQHVLSIGFGVHLSPCPAGDCALATVDSCFDRVRDGTETDVDCGGSCLPCAPQLACAVSSDCQTESCSGTCAAPSCSDGLRDGFESDVDCGSVCGGCAGGKGCLGDADCASHICTTSFGGPGICSS